MCFMERAISTTAAVEEWRPVKGWEGLYEVSNLGRVRSLDRYVVHKTIVKKNYTKLMKGRILSQTINSQNKYLTVGLHDGGSYRCVRVHRLVAEAFIPNPDNLPEVNHKDEDKSNNKVDNLEWCDRAYNMNYGTVIKRTAAARSKPVEQLTLDGKHVAYFPSHRDIKRLSDGKYHRQSVYMVLKGKCKTAYGYLWRLVDNPSKEDTTHT